MNDQDLLLGFRFGVSFQTSTGADAHHVDTRFQKVSGIGASLQTRSHAEGGLNLYAHRLPEPVTYDNLVLERGRVVKSTLSQAFTEALETFAFKPLNVIVILYGDDLQPKSSWMFRQAFPVRWRLSDFDAGQNAVVIETLEFAYANMQSLRV